MGNPTVGPPESFHEFGEVVWKVKKGKLIAAPRRVVRNCELLLQFGMAFLDDGSFWCNSGYSCLAGTTNGKIVGWI